MFGTDEGRSDLNFDVALRDPRKWIRHKGLPDAGRGT